MKKTNKRVSAKALIAAFVLLAVLFSGMVYAALYHGKAVQFGTVRGAHAFGAARLMQGASSQYQARMYDDEEIVLRALDNGVLDAALVSVENALKLDAEIYEIRGVFSVTDLMVLSSEDTVLGMQSLSGRKLILPEKLRGSKEEGMLLALMAEADTAGADIVYAARPAEEWRKAAGALVLVHPDDLYDVLAAEPALHVRFRLSSEWRTRMLTVPPAGSCIVVRREIIGTGTCTAFEKAVRDSVTYADRKRKKTIAMAVETGIFQSETQADRLIDYMSFTYHEGKDAQTAIDNWRRL